MIFILVSFSCIKDYVSLFTIITLSIDQKTFKYLTFLMSDG